MKRPSNPKLIEVAKEICRRLRRDQTVAEAILWEELRNRKFHGLKFYRQHPLFVEVENRETFYVADFYCHAKGIVVELDGEIHHGRWEQDRKRDEILSGNHLRVIRFQNREIEDGLPRALLTLARFAGIDSPIERRSDC